MEIAELAAAARRDGAPVTRAELLRRGVSSSTVTRATQDRRLVRLGRGVYAAPGAAVDPLIVAALATGGTVSHDSAAALLGWELAHPAGQHLTVPRSAGRRHAPGVQLHRCDLAAEDFGTVDGVHITSPTRTVLDCARVLPLCDAVVAADSALRSGLLSPSALTEAARAARGPGSHRIRRAASLADPLAGSVLESVLRFLFHSNGLHPVTQYRVRDLNGRLLAVADFYFPLARLMVEADGFAFHSSRDDLNRDIAKSNAYALLGYKLLRFSWEDVVHRPDYVLRSVRAILAAAA